MTASPRLNLADLRARKTGDKIVVLTAYTAPMARLLDPHVDVLMVGDSLGMTVYGMENTLNVSLEMMIVHGRAVVKASRHALVVVDLPFGSYQESPAQAFAASVRVIKETGAAAVKLEGGQEMAETISFLVERGIPVMAHIGLKPQHVNVYGGFRYQGRTEEDKARILGDARAVESAGAFAVVLEALREDVARDITLAVAIPTIGIGASPVCDGQVLVIDDILGLSVHTPKFAKKFAHLAEVVGNAAEAYAKEVRSGIFPSAEYCFGVKE